MREAKVWWKKERRYAVLLHAQNLIITDDAGAERVGGAYAWRHVTSTDRETAIRKAIDSLVTSPVFVQEVRHVTEAPPDIVAEEVVSLDADAEDRSTGIVFYIDTDREN